MMSSLMRCMPAESDGDDAVREAGKRYVPFREVLYKSLGKSVGAKQGLAREAWNFLVVFNQWFDCIISG
ncbi:hypothetical protein BCEN4_50063 [Burkholderia cenocepacia]|nr:hypothetical protein BCEN4_50063 [Burkholderia cenocepacia]